jgi:hypothetical protein
MQRGRRCYHLKLVARGPLMQKSESARFSTVVVLRHLTACSVRIKESLRKKFAELANDFERRLSAISSELAAIEGPLEVVTYLTYS